MGTKTRTWLTQVCTWWFLPCVFWSCPDPLCHSPPPQGEPQVSSSPLPIKAHAPLKVLSGSWCYPQRLALSNRCACPFICWLGEGSSLGTAWSTSQPSCLANSVLSLTPFK